MNMKKNNKGIFLILIAIVLVSLITACSIIPSNQSSNSSKSSSSGVTSKDETSVSSISGSQSSDSSSSSSSKPTTKPTILEKIKDFWRSMTQVSLLGSVLDPKDIVDSFTYIPTPSVTDDHINMPEVPEGFTVAIASSSNTNIIGLDGKVNLPSDFTTVNVSVKVTRIKDNRVVTSKPITMMISPRPTDTQSNVNITYQSLRYGLFIHWVAGDNKSQSGAGLVKPDGSQSKGINVYSNELKENLDKIVNDIATLGFEVVYVTDFHGLGTVLHPSKTIDFWRGAGTFTSEYDLLGNFISKLKAKGIYTVIFTHPLDGHDYSSKQQKLLGWTDPTDNFRKWNDYINSVYSEIAIRYGKDIVGIGFDSAFNQQPQEQIGGVGKLDQVRLRNTIKAYAPNVQLIGLGMPNSTTDLYIKEQWRPYWFNFDSSTNFTTPPAGSNDPGFIEADYDTDTWPSYNRPPAVVMTNHWTVISRNNLNLLRLSGTQMFRYTVLQHGTSYFGPAILWANSPYATGDWQMNIYEQFSVTKRLMDPIRESLKGTLPSTSYVTPQKKTIKNINYGIVATRKPDNTIEYIHVLRPPTTKAIVLGATADGKRFSQGVLLPSNKPVILSYNLSGGLTIILPADENWGKLDTVIKLTVTPATMPQENLAYLKPVFYSSSNEAITAENNSFTHMGITDGTPFPWSSVVSMDLKPQWIKIDLMKNYSISKVALTPNQEGFPTDFKIDISTDNVNWITVISKTNVSNPGSKVVYTFDAKMSRYVRVTGTKGIDLNGKFILNEVEVYN